jgi:hypothetical protein
VQRTFLEVKPGTSSDFHDHTGSARPTLPDRSFDAPLVYHLYGSLEQPSSLVLSDSDRLDFIVSVVSDQPPLTAKLRSVLCDPERSFLFQADRPTHRGRAARERHRHLAGPRRAAGRRTLGCTATAPGRLTWGVGVELEGIEPRSRMAGQAVDPVVVRDGADVEITLRSPSARSRRSSEPRSHVALEQRRSPVGA